MTSHQHLGKYRLVRIIGRGAMGEVWAAVNVDTDREVALKLITSPEPEIRRRLLREARAIGRLDHPNIVQILDRGETETGVPFLVMQLLVGESLAHRLRREHALSQPVAAGIALEVARALRAAHAKEIIHRDLKPANVFLHRERDNNHCVVKVVDFGVSKLAIENDMGVTVAGGVVGSPAYMSPEQVRSIGVDGRSDVWALGVVLFEMLAGVRPFRGPGAAPLLSQILGQPIPSVATLVHNVDPALARVVAACLEREAARRITADDLCLRLEPIVARLTTPPRVSEREAFLPEPPLPKADVARDSYDSSLPTQVFQTESSVQPSPAAFGAGTVLLLPAPAQVRAPAHAIDSESLPTEIFDGPPLPLRPVPPPDDDESRPTNELIPAPAALKPPLQPLHAGTVMLAPDAPVPSPAALPPTPPSGVTTSAPLAGPAAVAAPVRRTGLAVFLGLAGAALLASVAALVLTLSKEPEAVPAALAPAGSPASASDGGGVSTSSAPP